MEKKSKQGTLVYISVLIADFFSSWLIGPFIYDDIGFEKKLFLSLLPATVISLFYYYHLHAKGYDLKLWKLLFHYGIFTVLIGTFLFYPWWISNMVPMQLSISIVSIIHLELFKLLFKPRMVKISFNVYIFCFFTSFFLPYRYAAIGIFMWMFVLTLVPLYFENSRSRQQQMFKYRKINL